MSFIESPTSEIEREKVLLYSQAGIGKTYAILKLAELWATINPEAWVYVIDADDGVGKLWRAEFPDVTNLRYSLVRTWPDVSAKIKEIKAQIQPDDWIAIDMIGRYWELAQSYEVGEVYGEDAAEYLLAARKQAVEASKTNQPPTLASVDWNVVKRLHNDSFIDDIIGHWKCHVLATTSADPIIAEFDTEETKSLFGQYGFKPDGEKRNPHRFDTVMLLTKIKAGDRFFTTIKDRGRPLLDKEPFGKDLWLSYDECLRTSGDFHFLPD